MSSCTCEDLTQKKTLTCFNKQCNSKWEVALDDFERMANCSQHRHCVAICGGGSPSLCGQCESNGYYLVADRSQDMWFPKFKLANKSENEFPHSVNQGGKRGGID